MQLKYITETDIQKLVASALTPPLRMPMIKQLQQPTRIRRFEGSAIQQRERLVRMSGSSSRRSTRVGHMSNHEIHGTPRLLNGAAVNNFHSDEADLGSVIRRLADEQDETLHLMM
jgi:hypothetical protein